MGALDRFIVFLLMLLMLGLGLSLLGHALGVLPIHALDWMLYYLDFNLEVGIAGAVLSLLSLKVLAGYLTRTGPAVETVSRQMEQGELQISLNAIQELAQKTARKIQGLKENRTEVRKAPEGLLIKVNVAASAEGDVSAASSQLQEAVAQKVLEVMGVEVQNVRVVVDRVAGEGDSNSSRSRAQ